MYKISHEVINFIKKTWKPKEFNWQREENAWLKQRSKSGIFQGDALSPLLFINAMISLNHYLRKCTAGYKLSRWQQKINHRWHQTIRKKWKRTGNSNTHRIYHQDIGMEYEIEKCVMLVMKSGKRHRNDGMELPNQDKIRMHGENETYKYLEILEADTINQVQMDDKTQKEYLRRTRKLFKTKLSSWNLIKGINTWALPLVRYSGPFLKWTRDEHKQMDQGTRKLMHKVLHPRDDVDRLYVSRKKGGRRLASIDRSIDASIQRLENYIEKYKWGLTTAIRSKTDNTIDNRMTISRKQKMGRKTTLWAF